MTYAIAYTKEGTTLTYYLNRFWTGGFIWSLVRTSQDDRSNAAFYQPALRFETEAAANEFIVRELAPTTSVSTARAVRVED